jgi:Protein of unknown function DUF262/HNH endonuclease
MPAGSLAFDKKGRTVKATPDIKTVSQLLDLRKANMLVVNPEYQRGAVWTLPQQKKLVDSVLRGYHIPLIYLHYIKRQVAGITQEGYEVIDGQQRINSLYLYTEGQFKLFDPIADEAEARFPSFIKEMPCDWGGKLFDDLTPERRQKFLDTELSVVLIETEIPNEARDLFIRLQGGMPLNSQEKRDAWPGNFTEFILKIGGKPELLKYPGHDFFKVVMKAKNSNRGNFRQLAAQIVMLYLTRRETDGERLCDTNRDAIDTFYYRHLTFDMQSPEVRRFKDILDLLTQLLGDGKRSKVIGHEAIHLVLLVDSLLDAYTRGWTAHFAEAFDKFRHEFAEAKKTRFEDNPSEYWRKYGELTRVNSDRADNILRRHQFYAEKMYGWLSPVLKDPQRGFDPIEREIIYYRERKRCQVCGSDVLWSDHEIHHVDGHAQGGKTVLENGALVHKHCHPKGRAAEQFAKTFREKKLGTEQKG